MSVASAASIFLARRKGTPRAPCRARRSPSNASRGGLSHPEERSAEGRRIGERISWIVTPWMFTAVFDVVISTTLVPRLSDGFGWSVLSIVVGCVFLTFLAAAVSMTMEALDERR